MSEMIPQLAMAWPRNNERDQIGTAPRPASTAPGQTNLLLPQDDELDALQSGGLLDPQTAALVRENRLAPSAATPGPQFAAPLVSPAPPEGSLSRIPPGAPAFISPAPPEASLYSTFPGGEPPVVSPPPKSATTGPEDSFGVMQSDANPPPETPTSPVAAAAMGPGATTTQQDQRELNRLRNMGLPDDVIRQGDEQGIWGPAGKMTAAMTAEDDARQALVNAQSAAANQQAFKLGVAENAQKILTAQQEEEQRKIEQQIEKRTKRVESLRDEYDKMEVTDPWASKSTGQKVTAAIAILLGGIGAGLTGGPNMALQVINDAIERDLEIQASKKAAKGESVRQERSLLGDLRNQLGDLRSAQVLARDQMWRGVELNLKKMSAGIKSEEVRREADVALAQVAQKREQLKIEMREAASTAARTEFYHDRERQAVAALSRAGNDPAEQARILIESGVPDMVSRGVALQGALLNKEGKAGGALNDPKSGLGKIMHDFRSGQFGNPDDPATQAMAGRALENELAQSGVGTDRMIAQWMQDYEQSPETLTKERRTALQLLSVVGRDPSAGVVAGLPAFQGVERVLGQAGAPQPQGAAPAAPALPQVSSRADYDALPSGAEYVDPNGTRRRKP